MRLKYGWLLALMLIGAGVAHAQETGPWKVVVSSTANPLRVAECSPVRIDVTDARGSARNPKGVLISLADFDLSVAGSGGAIVGRYDGAAAWSACACPGTEGATATITASYPARSLPPDSRMPGLSFQTSINVPVIAGRSSAIPIGCEVVKTTTAGAGRDAAPWAVTIVPSVRAIPIGTCASIYIDLRDPIVKASPRNPKGILLSLADFDMSVTSASSGAVAGRVDGAAAWSVCACQAAAVGTTATITATYPARALDDALRVRGVAFESSTTITLAAAVGRFNPPACVSPQPSAIAPTSSSAAAGNAGATAGAGAGSLAGRGEAGSTAAAGPAAGGAAAGTVAGRASGAGAAGSAGAGAAGSAAAGAAAKGESTATGTATGQAAGAAAKGAVTGVGAAAGGAAGAAADAKIAAGAGAAAPASGAAGSAGAAASGAAGAGTAGAAAGGAASGSAAAGRAATTGPVGTPIGGGPVNRVYAPGAATASFSLTGRGSWYEPGPMNVNLGSLTGRGSWYEPGPVTVTFGLSGSGSWVERTPPGGALQPAPPRP